MGELRFEFFDEGDADSDKKFNSSVKNLLVLIKDFYGADSAAVYWFNKSKQGFKLLAVSEDGRVGSYKERFPLGNDCVSTVCLNKNAGIFNLDSDGILIEHHNGESHAKSVIVNPLLLEDETIAVVLCESRTLNFFGTPNIYTLQVFSESISNYIKYYSLHEDFDFENKLLGILASGKLRSEDEISDAIKSVFERYVSFRNLYVVLKTDGQLRITASYSADEREVPYSGVIESGSTVYLCAENKKIEVRSIGTEKNNSVRFSSAEQITSPLWFCCMPVIMDDECEAVLAFEALSNSQMDRKTLSKIYKQMLPFYLMLNLKRTRSGDGSGYRGKDAFLRELDSGMNKCRLFNENNLYCIIFGLDNADTAGESGETGMLFEDFITEKLPFEYVVYKIDENKYAMTAYVGSDEKVFLEIEKLRKSLSGKIYNIEGKDLSFTASFAIKRFDDLSQSGDDFLKELDNLYGLAVKEGGDTVKI